jgi:hypothetical protein
MRTGKSGGSFFVLIIVFVAGAAWLFFTFKGMQQAQASESWNSTAGEIENTWIEEDRRTDSDGDWEDYYIPHLSYSYEVGGTNYTSERVDFGSQPSYSNHSRAVNYLSDYPQGSQVDVFYDPADPSAAVLVREASGSTMSLIGGSVMILLSLGGGVLALLRRRQ